MRKTNFKNVSVVMGTRNEELAIAKVIKDIKKYAPGAEIVCVDGSTDKTPIIAKKLGAKVIKQKPQGYGIAVKTAILAGKGDILVTIDCDDTYPAKDIPKIVKLIEKGYDVVSCSRFWYKNKNIHLLNKIGNELFAKMVDICFGMKVTDVSTGMRAFRREVIHSINWTENIGLSLELLFRPKLHGYKIKEVGIRYKHRLGETKLNPYKGGLAMLKTIIKYAFIRK